jgi:hypothetical protein
MFDITSSIISHQTHTQHTHVRTHTHSLQEYILHNTLLGGPLSTIGEIGLLLVQLSSSHLPRTKYNVYSNNNRLIHLSLSHWV